MKQRRRHVLVVAYFFPPIGGVGVQRTLKFIQHLPNYGWRPSVVAPRGAAYRVMDPGLLAEVDPSVAIERALCIEPASIRRTIARIVRSGRDLVTRTLRAARHERRPGPQRAPGPAGDAAPRATPAPARRSGPRSWAEGAWRWWVTTLFVPDEQMAWVPPATFAARRIDRRDAVDVVYSSGPPVSTHLAAGLAASLIGRPWVADFRDPWVGNAFTAPRGRRRAAVERWLERWVIGRADRVVFATPTLRHRYALRYPGRAEHFRTVTNGYDAAELASLPAAADASRADDDPRFRITYTGSVYGEQELRVFLDGLALALERDATLRERLTVEFIGWMSVPNEQLARERREALAPVLVTRPFLPRTEALARLRSADAALLLLADGPDRDLFVGAKLFEYLGLDRPVLAMAPPGDTRAILADLDWGTVADPTPASVADAIGRLIAGPRRDGRADPEGRYERSTLAGILAEVLDEAVDATRASASAF